MPLPVWGPAVPEHFVVVLGRAVNSTSLVQALVAGRLGKDLNKNLLATTVLTECGDLDDARGLESEQRSSHEPR
ncbi:hypothetical protein Pdw03_7088 [Penicillium digitatum]|uniref:Uncharacterized protein n=1 Tax=Penicillium digitatum TaxID=36651 RepID=A0A7T6XLH0_PENDI|nr:hypothetical protein Pdw03_7088 [Penicillium digitatum]